MKVKYESPKHEGYFWARNLHDVSMGLLQWKIVQIRRERNLLTVFSVYSTYLDFPSSFEWGPEIFLPMELFND